MKKTLIILSLVFAFVFVSNKAIAQLDSTIMLCRSHMNLPFLSDGQSYTALLNGDEVAEFYATFYGGSTYRIVGYSGTAEGNIIFSVYDQEKNLLFTNNDYENIPYWDFEFDYSMDCIIEAKLDAKYLTSGIAVLLIGFQQ
ncbi:MAG: hypothetical protein PF517_11640 [Salinivirgaceae bacterium]|jgi:hypothetical protein|nr:hypothetical protein [Salinivirgaceae bacterium]